ncbi:MAG TPA: EAL domain-containing protein [Thermoanaerobaculia bacterium]|nr:EAL domain-containing protein [Thermoanaerobaculia bacterium]
MPEFTFAVLATFTAQAFGAAVMALLLLGFHRQYLKSYLLHWTLAWTSLAAYHLAIVGALAFVLRLHAQKFALPMTVLASPFGFLQIGWLLFGVYELIRRRPVRLRDARRGLLGLAALGVLVTLLTPGPSNDLLGNIFMRIGVRAGFIAAAFFFAAAWLWRRRARRVGFGFTVLSAAFLLYAIDQLHYAILMVVWVVTGRAHAYVMYLGYVDFLLLMAMGVGMIACLLEDEREAAELATVEIEHLAYHDALTGLPNRPLFIDRLIVALAQAHRGTQKLAVFFLDLDRFKDINDSLGHSVGDTLLKAVAERVRRCVREGDTVARFGGDEFTLLVPRIDNVEDAAKIAQKIIETLKIPFFIHDRELFVTTSIGISVFPGDGHDPETLVRNADAAMYRAKDQGRDNYQLYAPAMNERALERLALENMLRKALANHELVLFYQPLVDLTTRRIVGAEALIRWQHPELGLLSPAHFISVAELSGLIIPIGEWVLRTACRQLKVWQRKFDPDLSISINLSARQFQQPDLVGQIRSAIIETGVNAGSVELEITESNAMQNAENTIYSLRELKTLGVRIAMDDFGTGYSSLNYLKRFPIDTLKLDQSFVRDIRTDSSDAAIVSAVISMAHSLHLSVVAEGVETEEQLAFLALQQCDLIQGFLFSEPLAADALEPLLAARTALTV